MKEELKAKIYKEGIESFPGWWIILENLGFLLNWGIGFILLMPFRYNNLPVVSWAYLVTLIIFQILLKKHNCSTCYYYGKWCHLGWGKLTGYFFKPDSGSSEIGMKLALSYILQLPIILIGSLIAGFLYGFTSTYVVLLLTFVVINILQAALRPKCCSLCKARFICIGSAAKK